MEWLGVNFEGITPQVILKKRTVNYKVYNKKVLPVAQKYDSQVFSDNRMFQQDGAMNHTS